MIGSGVVDDRDMADDGRSMRDRMLAGEPYLFDDSLYEDTQRCRVLLERINQASPHQDDERDELLRELLGSFGEESNIRPPFRCEYGYQLHVGARTFVNFGLVCLDVATVTIGDDVQIGPSVQLLTPTHPLDPAERRAKWESAEPITIGDNVWLGGGVIVCPGVTIGRDAVVGAGAVVTKDLPAGVLAVGNPARVVRRLDGDTNSQA